MRGLLKRGAKLVFIRKTNPETTSLTKLPLFFVSMTIQCELFQLKTVKDKELPLYQKINLPVNSYGSEVNLVITSQGLQAMSLSQHKPNEPMINLHTSEDNLKG